MTYEKVFIPDKLDGYLWQMQRRTSAYMDAHTHRELEFNLVVEGQAEYIVQNYQYTITANSLIWLFPDQSHVLINASDNFKMMIGVIRPQSLAFLITKGADPKLLALDPGRMVPRMLMKRDANLITREIEEAASFIDLPVLYNLELSAIYLKLWRYYETATITEPSCKVPIAVEVCLQKLQNLNDAITLEGLSDELGYSASQLSRLFKKYTGYSVVEYRNRLRLQFVASQLNQPKTNFTALAYKAGFGSYAQFYRAFKAAFGYAPKQAKRTKTK